ncbi:hypothetical protein HPQ64_03965 [Rhizobiales bacterium]|uniref:pilus assembly protein n=1 Tax=Hongsoonwoonella zoysiae TaxID=2821844 RepID=UPI00156144FE|nr:pilus assembly protein [Hongsoonwoonella zoysiae]NRG16844.1 hypothetical protein [Hongsoonwoonella zoysiae]
MSWRKKAEDWESAGGVFLRFGRDRRGGVLPLFGLVAIITIVIVGAAIDIGRAVNQKRSLARGLDAAMLAVARELSVRNMTPAEVQQYVDEFYQDFFDANSENSTAPDAKIILDPPVIDTDKRRIDVSARTTIPTYFISIGGIGPETLTMGVTAQAVYPKSVEIAMVVDVTGSMAGSGKIGALRDAAADFVNILIPPEAAATNEKVRISMVPYSTGVNIGTSRATLATGGWNASRNSFEYCVSERGGAQAATDVSYATAPVGPGTVRAGRKKGYRKSGSNLYASSDYICPESALIPLTLDPGGAGVSGSLLHSIDNLQAKGYTAGATGITWGWYTLSANWSGLWPAESRPAPYSDERVLKYLIVMTDGDFNTIFGPTTHYGTDYDWMAQNNSYEARQRAIALCDSIKQNTEIRIITIGFQIGSTQKAMMQDCASSSGDYHNASNNQELREQFQKIALQIKKTYLSR